jgi:hypothetical protein
MRRSLAPISIFLLFSIGLFGCGGDQKKETVQEKKEMTSSELLASQGSKMFTWDFIPMYPAATQEKSDIIGGLPQYQTAQVRQFVAPDPPAQVHEFYLAQMPDKGWTSFGQSQMEGVYQSTWGTEDKSIMCWIKAQKHPSGSGSEIEITRAKAKTE